MNVDSAQVDKLHALYHEAILARSRKPERFGRLSDATHKASGLNPLCGDKIEIDLRVTSDQIAAYRFQAIGCALCVATGAIIGESTEEKSVSSAKELVNQTLHALDSRSAAFPVGALSDLDHVREFPSRIKCVSLPLVAFLAALKGSESTVSSE